MKFDSSENLNKYVAEISNETCLLSFSTGKDAIGCWLELRKYFKKIIPCYYYLVPNLSFIEKSLRYYEEFFETKIIRVPSPNFCKMLRTFINQVPGNMDIIKSFNITKIDYLDLYNAIKEDCGLSTDTYTAVGVRASDSLIRYTAIKTHGSLNEKKKQFYPVFDWKIERLVSELKKSGIKLPVDYRLFGKTFDGLDYKFIKPIKEYYPDDFKKIEQIFPLTNLDIIRYEKL
jgi:hypothetical protein